MRGIFDLIFRYREKRSPDQLGLFPEKVHIEAMPERRYLWTSRILVIVGAMSICFSISLAMTIYILLPQRGAYPQFITLDEVTSGLKRVQPQEISSYAQPLITESLLQKYVMMRHEVPLKQYELMSRWAENSEFYDLSTDEVYQKFRLKMTNEQINNFIINNMRREIIFEETRHLSNNLWLFQFRTLTRRGDNVVPKIDRWRAYVKVSYERPKEGERIKRTNPFGMKIVNYSLAYLGDVRAEQEDTYLDAVKRIRTREADK